MFHPPENKKAEFIWIIIENNVEIVYMNCNVCS